jgi:hypothetical protein
MRKDSLINTNPYLRDPRQRHQMLVKAVISSTAVEGVYLELLESGEPHYPPNKRPKSHNSGLFSGSRR